MTVDVIAGSGRVSVAPGCVGWTNGVGDAGINVAGCATMTEYHIFLLPKFQCIDATHPLIYLFNPAK